MLLKMVCTHGLWEYSSVCCWIKWQRSSVLPFSIWPLNSKISWNFLIFPFHNCMCGTNFADKSLILSLPLHKLMITVRLPNLSHSLLTFIVPVNGSSVDVCFMLLWTKSETPVRQHGLIFFFLWIGRISCIITCHSSCHLSLLLLGLFSPTFIFPPICRLLLYHTKYVTLCIHYHLQ
jgi:hypothetical protein